MSEKTIKEIILPQRFSSNGIRVGELTAPAPGTPGDTFAGYAVLFNFFVELGGLGMRHIIYATDIAKLKNEFKDEKGEFTLECAKKMGLKGSDKELAAAIQLMEDLFTRELTAQDTYPIKISDFEQLNYTKDGLVLSRTLIDPVTKEFAEIVYDRGDVERIIKKYLKKPDGTLHFIEYNELDLTKIQAEAVTSPSGAKIKRIYSYDNKNKLKSYYESSHNFYRTTLVDEHGRIVFVHETLGHMIKRKVYIYDDAAQTVLYEVEGEPKLLAEGILRKKTTYATQNGKMTDTVLSETNIMMSGETVQIS